jgi:hypothetical protein
MTLSSSVAQVWEREPENLLFHSIPHHSSGGIVTMVPKQLFREFACSGCSFAASRVHRLEIQHPLSGAMLIIWNVHLFDIIDTDMACIVDQMRIDQVLCDTGGGSVLSLVAGDFNYRVAGAARLYLQEPARVAAPEVLSGLERRMHAALASGFELSQNTHTHTTMLVH